mgnify:CR=1 FL=1
MKHLTNLAIAAGVFIFTKLYAETISHNSIDFDGSNLIGQILVMTFVIQWIAYIPAFLFKTEKFYDLTGSLTYIGTILFAVIFWWTMTPGAYLYAHPSVQMSVWSYWLLFFHAVLFFVILDLYTPELLITSELWDQREA